MSTLITRPARQSSQVHQKNWGVTLAQGWQRWRLRWARHSQRRVLCELVDDQHLLADIGVTRDEALTEAARPFWDITDIYIHSL
jgi:uncharacterized protein YjiS (DUF1127 family)